MFAPLRITAVVGLIFYFSPLRQPFELPSAIGRLLGTADAPQGPVAAADEPWRALPAQAKQALLEHLVASALGARPSHPVALELPSPRDTLELEDLQPPWRGDSPSARASPRVTDSNPGTQHRHGDRPRL